MTIDQVLSCRVRAGLCAGVAVASLLVAVPGGLTAQAAEPQQPAATQPADASGAPAQEAPSATAPAPAPAESQAAPAESQAAKPQLPAPIDATLATLDTTKGKVKQSKDTRKALKRERRTVTEEKALTENPLAGQDAKLPDKALYDKAQIAMKKGKYDVARLDLQTLLNTYPDSQYQMRAKLAFADSWYKEGGTAALTQAEAEYSDFRVFFPNTPEAAEAQMRIGDIYFRQMDKPDRDYSKATHAEEEYRRMLTDYPDSKLVPFAKQRLRDVQEALATREASIGQYYSTRENWPATIARYQTVVDTYPLYSRIDEVLIGLGDAYAAEARAVRAQQLPEAPKARLEKIYDDQAIAAYRRVVLEHAAAPHVEDARDRLAAMNQPIPTPSAEQMRASQEMENGRGQYRLQDRAKLLFFHQPDVVQAARNGEPTMADPHATLAPEVTKQLIADFNGALHPGVAEPNATAPAGGETPAATDTATAAPAADTPAAPLALRDVPNADGSTGTGDVNETTPAAGASTGAPGASVGAEVLTPGATSSGASTGTPATTRAADPNYGLKAVGPPTNTALPPVEKAGPAPDAVNDITPGSQPAAQQKTPGKKKQPAPGFDKSDESSSKHKKKKGLDKLNPF